MQFLRSNSSREFAFAGYNNLMETREVVAYALCAIMVLFLLLAFARYRRNRRQFKIRQMGRGKNTIEIDPSASE